MNKNTVTGIFSGVFIIAIGAVLGGNAVGIWDIDLFFPGFWTLFIILPCLYKLIKSGPDTVGIAGLIIGVLLLFDNTKLFGKYISCRLVFPVIIVVIGVNTVLCSFRKKGKTRKENASGE